MQVGSAEEAADTLKRRQRDEDGPWGKASSRETAQESVRHQMSQNQAHCTKPAESVQQPCSVYSNLPKNVTELF